MSPSPSPKSSSALRHRPAIRSSRGEDRAHRNADARASRERRAARRGGQSAAILLDTDLWRRITRDVFQSACRSARPHRALGDSCRRRSTAWKQDLVAKIARTRNSRRARRRRSIDSFIDGITKALKKGDSITFVGFGTFKTSMQGAHGQNPQTGPPSRSRNGVWCGSPPAPPSSRPQPSRGGAAACHDHPRVGKRG